MDAQTYESRTERLAAMIKKAKNGILLTGAGFSTESGLTDFRSPESVRHCAESYGLPPERILTEDCFLREPELFFRYYREVFLAQAEANAGHFAAASFERAGHLSVITQNTDGLHQAAGSVRVLELHGSSRECRCLSCGRYHPGSLLGGDDPIPLCPVCGGRLRPCIVLYDEPLEEAVLRTARARMFSADLLIIAGTSLSVYPAADLPQYFPGRNEVIINRTPTPRDGEAVLRFYEDTGKVLSDAAEAMKAKPR